MQALTSNQYGGPEVLTIGETPMPKVGPRDVLVRVHASSVTQGDRRLRAADYPGLSAIFGRLITGLLRPRHAVGGTHFAGRVVQVGSEVTSFQAGDDVFGGSMHGAYAQYMTVPEQGPLAKMPPSLSYADAVVLPYGAGTSLTFLRDLAKVQPGERVLIVGAAGGVGRMAVQVAKYLGAHVTAVCGGGAEIVRSLGADEVIDYRREDVAQSTKRWDVILDTIEGDHFGQYQNILSQKGRYLSVYMTLKLALQMLIWPLFNGKRPIVGVALPNSVTMKQIADLGERGILRDVIAERFPFSQAARAHSLLERQRPYGSIVIDITDTQAHLGGLAPREAPSRPAAAAE